MINIPKFSLYGQDDPATERNIQPTLPLRNWSDLNSEEKKIALQELKNQGWLSDYSEEVLITIIYLNREFLRLCPGKHLHAIQPKNDSRGYGGNKSERMAAALLDFQHIFLTETSDSMVLMMLSKFTQSHINQSYYRLAEEAVEDKDKEDSLVKAFEAFDRLVNCLNHIFEQFSVNQMVTRNGFIPRQDKKIINDIYSPTLEVLASPKWKTVSDSLADMFNDYREENYSEVITKAHSSVQRFLQVLVGEEGKNGKGEVGRLFAEAKERKIIPINRFTEPLVNMIQGYISSERAVNSTAKPSLKGATNSDALLMMNVVMVFLQYCLQEKR